MALSSEITGMVQANVGHKVKLLTLSVRLVLYVMRTAPTQKKLPQTVTMVVKPITPPDATWLRGWERQPAEELW